MMLGRLLLLEQVLAGVTAQKSNASKATLRRLVPTMPHRAVSFMELAFPIKSKDECPGGEDTHCVVVTLDKTMACKFVELSGQCSGAGCCDEQIAADGLNCLCSHRWQGFIESGTEQRDFAANANPDFAKCKKEAVDKINVALGQGGSGGSPSPSGGGSEEPADKSFASSFGGIIVASIMSIASSSIASNAVATF